MKRAERFTERARRALEEAWRASSAMGHSYVGTEHLLLGLVREGEGLACRIMRRAGLEEERLRAAVEEAAGAGSSGPPAHGLSADGAPEGTVVDQTPSAGTIIDAGDTVSFNAQ